MLDQLRLGQGGKKKSLISSEKRNVQEVIMHRKQKDRAMEKKNKTRVNIGQRCQRSQVSP